LTARGQTGNGAKFWPNGSANKAGVAGVRLGKIFHFRRPFLWFISFGRTKEMNNYYRRTKEPIRHLAESSFQANEQLDKSN